ncbi:MocR-like pyridoxine biosynthesis transcription factor PdxR [Flexibacterium corallicola]|uniref:MocR-like pyridoxine biosynthesis transcription factor PdxR n=1 Tax=Flexibacterium corallicola TaxID=3037259 RepID=UPI00286F22ED|nr:PLP-dependent aminotransferase family protein [Pseudovibrio sp. M1P-2-3]
MLEYLINLDRVSPIPLSSQIYRGLRTAIVTGRVREGEKLPSSRRLSSSLGVSRNTVNSAYELLIAEELILVCSGTAPVVRARAGAFAVEGEPLPVAKAGRLSKRGQQYACASRYKPAGARGELMRPGEPSKELFPYEQWARSLRRAARMVKGGVLGYDHRQGLPELREVLARYLAQERGVKAVAEQVFIFPSVQAAISLVAQCYSDPQDHALMEDPGYLGARDALQTSGLTMHGFNPSEGVKAAPRQAYSLIYVTPSHQFPLGMRMSMRQREELVAFAAQTGAMILEDDYDSEFLWEGRPLVSLQGLGQSDNIIYLGTAAKSLMPAIRLAYAVMPVGHLEELRTAHQSMGMLGNVHAQAALTHFIEEGYYRSHLRKIRGAYQTNAEILMSALRGSLGNTVGFSKPVGGLQMPLFLPEECNDVAIADNLNRAGFGVNPLSLHYLSAKKQGLVLGFSELNAPTAQTFVQHLKALL